MLRMLRLLGPFSLAMSGAVLSAQIQTQCETQGGATVNDLPVSASATFTPGTGTIIVVLSNGLADPRSAGQLLSGLAFTVSEGETTGTLGPNSAEIITVARGGASVDIGPGTTGWALEQNFNGGFFLCVLCTDLGAVGPHQLLIGPPTGDGNYDSANASIAGNRPHNPFTSGPAMFMINAPNVTPNSTIIGAAFFFGTTQGVSVAGTCSGAGAPM